MFWWTKVDAELVTDKNFVCQLQFPSDAGTSRENGWAEEGWGLEPAGPWMRVKYYESTFRYVSRLGEQIGGQGRNKLEASRPDKGQAKVAWPRRGTSVTTNSRGGIRRAETAQTGSAAADH